jgi:hypothetical protein
MAPVEPLVAPHGAAGVDPAGGGDSAPVRERAVQRLRQPAQGLF